MKKSVSSFSVTRLGAVLTFFVFLLSLFFVSVLYFIPQNMTRYVFFRFAKGSLSPDIGVI